ncbi:glycosyltransferase involved in cell wall biosynthesis [Roseibium hamelinense]|uniref:Glycosyltransferase involved in cell wall biosynthesis n=1 Tax=Roseibium hamelinense TaxID=150831 RepID=A0A562T8A7_9HYPH|nr:glycosyltransferase family 4 protein [Roseibium hamelinense]MTI43752.1 colanic acid biosynthesis glycosyltransferase WcaL [Roseibium hamelinense]TWI89438.1 glycosyltransferase involved in cell wall biosynthesis [Roseibium hamelinense]
MSRIAVVLKGYPRLSETFIAQEILGLEQRGIPILIVALRKPYDPYIHELHRLISAEILYLPEYVKDDPARVARAKRWAENQPTYEKAKALFEADLARQSNADRQRRWAQGCVFAHELPEDITWIHTHYLHTPCSAARYAAHLAGRGWSFSAHAKDIWTSPDWDLKTKLDDTAWGVTCTGVNARHLKSLCDDPEKVELVYHGLDFTGFPEPSGVPSTRDGTADPVRLVSVGRAVEKKGYDDLLAALSALPKELNWQFTHVGGGELSDALKAQADALGLSGRIIWRGAQPREAVIEACRLSDLFVLPSKLAKSGDRDGLPNVLMEAQSMGLCCLSTNVSAIPELIEDGKTGRLVPPADPVALAEALKALIRGPAERDRLGHAGAEHVRAAFSTEPGLDYLAGKFRKFL